MQYFLNISFSIASFLITDASVATCVPTKDKDALGVYAAMTGYDPIIGNPNDGLVDEGAKARIFLHDCKWGYYSFVSDVGTDLNCAADFSMRTITTLDAYDNERTSSNKFAASASISASGKVFGAKTSVKASYAYASNKNQRSVEKVLNEYGGEVVIAESTCITESVSIADNVRPVFTEDFINHLKVLDSAAATENIASQKDAMRAFINEFGTHFMRTTKLGAQIIYERRYEKKSTTTDEEEQRSSCVKNEAALSVTASWKSGGILSSSREVSAEAKLAIDNCKAANLKSSFALDSGVETTKTISRGSRPKDVSEWIDDEFTPVPIIRYLDTMTALFKDEWLTKNDFFGFDKDLSGENIARMFDEIASNYCELMLDGILDSECNLIGAYLFNNYT